MNSPEAQTARRVDFGHRIMVTRTGGVALRWRVRPLIICALLGALTVAVTIWALTRGEYPLTVWEVVAALANDPDAGFARIVVFEWRLPRVLAAVTFGAALGVAGAVFQSVTRNPLASPDIIGFSTGSYTGALIVMILIGGGYAQVAGGALAGGLVVAALVYLLAWRGGIQGFRLIIVGIAISAVLGSINVWLMLTARLEVAMTAAVWGAGTLTAITWAQAGIGSLVVLVLLVGLAAAARGLRQLELGDDAAAATGVRAEPVRLVVMVIGVALTATVTAAAGPIAFVALAAPQIARRLARSPGIALVPAAFTGALLLAGADLVAQHLLPQSFPVGVVTVIVGGGYLIWLLIREARRRV
ncbi:FecCD family ABC transporter permease [Rhodococcus artemisiae]|uniref:Iron chelate uptake ABC transporter family permease subunit n=1 Tax=Rhodococcus artemisiae TaxID=714159 RepID=A0ABU7LBZ8_9NOCA|nr:iron chelate uptake ABC transporter family permease subunit [Rhodococcus artemisiae]